MQTTDNLGLKKPESTEFYDIQVMNDNMDILDEKVQECFQSVSDGKVLIASAITDKGVNTPQDATFAVMATNINNISTGADTSGDTVVEAALLAGYTAHNANQEQIIGTLPDKTSTANHAATASLDSTNSRLKMKIPSLGRYGTSNYLYAAYSTIASLIGLTAAKIVKGNTILGITGNSNNMDTSGADATAAQILSGKKACVDGSLLTGTMTNRQGTTVDATAVSSDDTYTYLTTPSGSYSATSKIRTLNSNLDYNFTQSTYTTGSANQEVYTFNENVDILIIRGDSSSNALLGYVDSTYYDEIVYGKKYAWGTWDTLLVVKGVKAGFKVQFGYAKTNFVIIKGIK